MSKKTITVLSVAVGVGAIAILGLGAFTYSAISQQNQALDNVLWQNSKALPRQASIWTVR